MGGREGSEDILARRPQRLVLGGLDLLLNKPDGARLDVLDEGVLAELGRGRAVAIGLTLALILGEEALGVGGTSNPPQPPG